MANIPYLFQEVAPSTEPVTLTEAKLHLRVDSADEDTLITRLITVAREAAEKYTKRSLITQTWKLVYDGYAPSEVFLPRGPIQSVTSAKIIARDNTETTIATNTYYLNSGKEKVVFDAAPFGHTVEIIYVAGYGDASNVPDSIKQGMLTHISHLYESRSADLSLPKNSIPLYDAYRVIKL